MNLYSYRWRQEAVCLKVTGPAVINQNNRKLQLLLAMKLFLILLAIGLQVSAAALSQEITLSVKKAPFREVMQNLRIQTGYQFILQSSVLEEAKPVTITLHKIAIEDALKKIFEDQPFTYSISNKVVIIKKKETVTNLPQDPVSDPIIIKGKVTDRNNKPLPGVNIRIKGRDIGTVTDVNGNYTLKTDGPATLLFTYIGFRSYEQKVNAKTEINISLEDISSQLDQVQVIAYGTTTKRFTTSNISTVKGEEISKQPISNFLLGMQARVPGISITQSSGLPGSDVKVRVQGENSLRNGNEAFYVIDGIPYSPQNLYSGITGQVMSGTGSTLSFINPADVESIEILKDADATAIYGSRAANGAILITTKRGRIGKTKVDVNLQSGWGKTATKINLLNTKEYVEIRKEAIKNAGAAPDVTDYDINGVWDQSRSTDWQKELIGNTAHYTNVQSSISGGNENTQFVAGIGYIKETTVFPGDFSDAKENVHLAINHISTNKRFNFNINSNFLIDENRLPTADLTGSAISLPPDAPSLYNADGTINWSPDPNNPLSYTFYNNPVSVLLKKYTGKTYNILENGQLSYKILPSLVFKTNLGYNRLETEELSTTPQSSFNPSITNNVRSATYGTKNITSWIIEPQITYSDNFKFGSIEALLGSSFQSTNNSVRAFDGTNYANDAQLENSLAAGTIVPNINTMYSEYRYNAIFGRLKYQLKDKYLLNISARRDGSSRFGSKNLFNNFYAIGGGWIFSDEDWIKDKSSVLSFGKLRISYGTTGNDQINDYQFLNLYTNYTTNVTTPYQQTVGLLPAGLSNPYLQWEETRKLNIGIDLGLWQNRAMVNINYYRNRSSNQLLNYALPYITGFSSVQTNIPATIQNSGWEVLIDLTAIKRNSFSWQISTNLTVPRNRLIDYPNLATSPYSDLYSIGKTTNMMKVYEYAGVNQSTGLYEFKTFDGKLTSSPNYFIDRTKIIDLSQKFYGGINNTINFKGLELSVLFQFIKQIAPNYSFGNYFPGTNTNQPDFILERWRNPGDKSNIQKVSTYYDSFSPFITAKQSDAAYSDASYIRLKSASLYYSLPEKILERLKISQVRLYVQGQNLLTFTKFKGGDPESIVPGVLPPIRMISTGIQITF